MFSHISYSAVWLLLLASGARASAMLTANGTFQTKCLERHFWLSVKSGNLSSVIRFDFEDEHGYHILSEEQAALCGYTVVINDVGDLVFRASFQACHVHTRMDTDYHLHVWLVNLQAKGKVEVFPFQLRCSLEEPWSSREIACEENYMEVSVKLPDLNWELKNIERVEMAAMFHRADEPSEKSLVMSLTEAAALGYHTSIHGSHLILRCRYSSALSYIIKDHGVDLETVTVTILYQLQSNFVAVDATVACTLNEATADESDLLWTVPLVPSPLVRGEFRESGVRIGVDGETLSESDIKERRYRIGSLHGRVEVRIPAGAPGGHMKSRASRGRYSPSMSVDLIFTSQWEDERWPLSQLRTFRILRALVTQTPVLTKTSSEDLLSVTLGPFASDISLQKVTVDSGGDLLTWTQSHQTRNDKNVAASRISHLNGSHSFLLTLPLSHPKILPDFIGAGYKMYSFLFIFTLNISTTKEVFYHYVTVEHHVEYTVPGSPTLEGKCTESSLLVLLHHGTNPELQWELFLGTRRLDLDLVEFNGFVVEADEDYLTVEIPMQSPGLYYQEMTLTGFVAGVTVSVVDAKSLKVHDALIYNCTFPAREILVCLPEGRMVAVVDTTHTIPPSHPNRTTLLDPSCVPVETDSARALFIFSLDTCGTIVTTEGNHLVYENQISYNQTFLPLNDPVIHRDSPYRLTIQCRFLANDKSALTLQYPSYTSTDFSPMMPVKPIHTESDKTGISLRV